MPALDLQNGSSIIPDLREPSYIPSFGKATTRFELQGDTDSVVINVNGASTSVMAVDDYLNGNIEVHSTNDLPYEIDSNGEVVGEIYNGAFVPKQNPNIVWNRVIDPSTNLDVLDETLKVDDQLSLQACCEGFSMMRFSSAGGLATGKLTVTIH